MFVDFGGNPPAAFPVARDQGHGLAIRGCTPRIMADFVEAADISAVDSSCLERVFAMPFFIDFSGPSP